MVWRFPPLLIAVRTGVCKSKGEEIKFYLAGQTRCCHRWPLLKRYVGVRPEDPVQKQIPPEEMMNLTNQIKTLSYQTNASGNKLLIQPTTNNDQRLCFLHVSRDRHDRRSTCLPSWTRGLCQLCRRLLIQDQPRRTETQFACTTDVCLSGSSRASVAGFVVLS